MFSFIVLCMSPHVNVSSTVNRVIQIYTETLSITVSNIIKKINFGEMSPSFQLDLNFKMLYKTKRIISHQWCKQCAYDELAWQWALRLLPTLAGFITAHLPANLFCPRALLPPPFRAMGADEAISAGGVRRQLGMEKPPENLSKWALDSMQTCRKMFL